MANKKEKSVTDSNIKTLEQVIDLVRSVRNEMTKNILQEDNLCRSYLDRFDKEITNIKKEFLKRDLQSLLIDPVDLVHYSSLIKKIKEENLQIIEAQHRSLFIEEIQIIFDKYA